jgi:hypothetical protein
MALSQYFSGSKGCHRSGWEPASIPKKHASKQFPDARQDLSGAAEMYLYFPGKSFTFSMFSRHLDDLGPRLTSAALLRKQEKS